MTTTPAPLGLLLDVDGPIASPITRTLAIPSIAADLVELAAAGVPVVFNTGRSDAFIREQVVGPLLAAGLPAGARVHAVCEMGASWFSIPATARGRCTSTGRSRSPRPTCATWSGSSPSASPTR